jgi:hypothetical protein
MFKGLLDKLTSKIGSYKRLLSKYDADLDDWKGRMSAVQKIKDEKERLFAIDELQSNTPKFAFPSEFQINKKDFCKKNGVVLQKYRRELDLETIHHSSIKDEELILLLFMGVGVYSSKATKGYTEQVLKLVSEGRLEFLITDVCYGFDYPFGTLFITKEFSDEKSTSDIYQLMSRIGRGRLSYVGQIYMDKSCAEKILGKDDTTNMEIENMFEVLLTV